MSTRVLLLAAQAFALGLTTAWVLIPATALFLDETGADRLPVTYIGAGLAGVAASAALTAALRRRPLAEVATRVLAGTAVALVASWVLLVRWDAGWVPFALLVVVPLVIPTGFVFIVGQAGALLDVRALKASYARVVAGFAFGFVAGGLLGPRLIAALGRTEHLLAAAAAAATFYLALVVATRRAFPVELAAADHDDDGGASAPTLRDLLRDRFVALIVAFQVLSAIESQWLDFLVFDRAAQRYDDAEALARFVSHFTVIAYGADIVFLLLLAGALLRRFGLRYGLAANSAAVLTLLVLVIGATLSSGSAATVVFVLVVAARVTDLVCSDGTSRTSLSAVYQVVPARFRLAAPARAEGLAVPVAIAASGAVLLLLGATVGTDGVVLPVLVAAVVSVWVGVAGALYRGYRTNLLDRLRHRELEPAALLLDGSRDLDVAATLLASADERDLRLALDVLASSSHPSLRAHLLRLTGDPRPGVRALSLERLVELDPTAAAEAARAALLDPDPQGLAAAVGVLGRIGAPEDLPAVSAFARHPMVTVRVAVAAAMAGLGDLDVRQAVAADVGRLSRSASADDRVEAARVLGACAPGALADRAPLVELVHDPDPAVLDAALAAVRWPEDTAVLVAADEALGASDGGPSDRESWARVCRAVGGAAGSAVLERHLGHPDRDVGLAVLAALGHLDDRGAGSGHERYRGSAVVAEDVEHAAHLLTAVVATESDPRAGLLLGALGDELDLLRRRVLSALSLGYGAEGVRRVAFQLTQADARSTALALEWLDVTLVGSDRAAMALLEPALPAAQRLAALGRWAPEVGSGPDALLRDLIEDPERRWRRPWLGACALHLAWQRMDEGDGESWIESLLDRPPVIPGADPDVLEETVAGLGRRRALGLA